METVENTDVRKYCVYLITNTVNGKRYVGQTCKVPMVRWEEHVRAATIKKASLLFSRAIRKHSPESFVLTVLAEGLTRDQADQEEIRHIKDLQTTDKNFGYNTALGGRGGSGNFNWNLKDEDVAQVYKTGLTLYGVGEKLGISECCVKTRLLRMGVSIRPVRKPVSNEDIVRMYEEGNSAVKISQKVGLATGTIFNRLKEAKVVTRPPGDHDDPKVDTNELIVLYQSGWTHKEIGEKVGLSRAGVAKRLGKVGVQSRMWGKPEITDEFILSLREQGLSLAKISSKVGLTRRGVSYRIERAKKGGK